MKQPLVLRPILCITLTTTTTYTSACLEILLILLLCKRTRPIIWNYTWFIYQRLFLHYLCPLRGYGVTTLIILLFTLTLHNLIKHLSKWWAHFIILLRRGRNIRRKRSFINSIWLLLCISLSIESFIKLSRVFL